MADTDWSQFSPVNQPASGETDWSNFSPADAPKKQNKGIAADLVTDVKRGVQQLPGAVTGLVDIPVSLVTGSPLVSGLADKAGEITGFQPSKWAKSAEAEYSPSRQAGRAEVDNAWEQGTVSDIAGAYLKNPMNIVGSVAESIPSMLVGGLAGRAALGIGAKTVSAGAGGVGAALPGVIARTVGTSMAPAVGAGIGEGGIMAGQAMQNSLEAGVDPRTAAGYAGATGLIGGALGTLGGKVAQKFGVVDPETLIAGGIGRQASNATGMAAAKEVGKRVAGGAISEGLFEELPQSVFEQGFQNLAQGKPLTEGMARAGIEGALAGSFMGGAFNAIPGGRYAESKAKTQEIPQDDQQPIAGLLPSPTYTGTPGDQLLNGAAARQAEIDAADKNAADLYAMRDAFEAARQNVTLVADPVPVQQRIDAMLGLDTARMDKKGRALYEKDLAAAFNEQIGITHDANQREVPFTMGEYLDAQVKTDDAVRARERIPAQSANQQSVTRLGVLAEEEAQQQVALTQDLARSAAQGGALSKAALSGMATGATQMPVHPMRAAIEQQMLSDEAAQAELAPIQRQMQSRSTEQVRRIAENEKAIPKIRQAAIADLQRRMATQAQPTTTSPLQQTATRFDMPAQSGIKQLQAQLEQADPFSEQSGVLIEKLQSAVTQDAQSALSAGQMPVYKVTDQVSVAIHPSAQNPGMVQVTRYTKDGVIGDSQYNNVDEAVRQEGLTHKPRIASNEAAAVIEQSIQAEAGYQQRMAVAPATPESQKADNRAKLEKARAKNVGPQSRDDLVGAILRVTGGNGIHPKMAQTIVGDKANAATKVRGLFTLRGQEDLDDIAELLRIQENYDVRDGNHLAELVREQAGGNPVYSMERIEREAAENEVRKYRDDIRRRAAELGIRTAFRKFDDVERDVLEAEAKQAQDEAVAERDAIQAEEAVSELDDDQINVLLDLATQENKENGRYINEQWISNDEILDAFDGTETLEEPEDAQGAARAGEAVAGDSGGNSQGRGDEAGFDLAAQTPEELRAKAEQERAAAAQAHREEVRAIRAEQAAKNKAEKDRRAAQVLAEREAAKKAEVDKDVEAFALGQNAPPPVVKKVTTEDARGQQDIVAQQQGNELVGAFTIRADGIEGKEIPASSVPNGSDAFQYALGKTEDDGATAIFRRKASERGTYGGWRWEADAQQKPAEPVAKAQSNEKETSIKHGDVSVGDTVYFTDIRDETKRIPANFRGFNGDQVVVVYDGGRQMSLPKDRVFKNDAQQVESDPVSMIEAVRKQYPLSDPPGMTSEEWSAFAKARTAATNKLIDDLTPQADGLMLPAGSYFYGVTKDTRPDGLGWRVTHFDGTDMTPTGHDTYATAREAVADVVSSYRPKEQSAEPVAQPKAEPAKAQEPAAKEPWQMTSAEFDAAKKRVHWPMVKEHGRIVPASKGVNAHFELNDDAPADIKTMNAVMNVSNHESAVSKAVREGKPVPANVLADYPDLKPATVDAVKPAKSEPSEMDALKAEMGQAIGELASILGVKQNLTPEEESRIIPVMSKIFRIAAKMGYIKFKDAAKYVLGQIRQLAGNDVADKISIDNLQAGYINIAKEIGGDKREAMSYDSIEDLEKADATDQRSSTDLERDSRDAEVENGVGEEGVRDGRDGNGGTGRPGVQGGEESIRAGSGSELRGSEAAAAGERGDLEIYTGAPELSPGSAGNRVDLGSRDSGLAGAPVEPDATKAIGEAATKQSELVASKAEQARADKTVAHKGGIAAIRDALPILTEGQQEDVAKAETRFAVPDGYGMLFTNGTGTGKTFTGLGAIKRLANQGKTNILIVAPNDKIVEDWQKAGKLLGLDITRLADTNDAGNGIVITTYANMGQNNALASREWDLVVSDEAHYLAMGKDGANTNALKTLRAITLHPDGVHHRHSMLNAADIERLKQLDADAKMQRMSDDQRNWYAAEKTQADADKLRNELRAKQEAIKADVAERQGEKRPRALFLSATPFAYEKTVDWANGYLFDYNEGRSNEEREFRGYNEGSNLDQFMMQHFGYRMRYGKLTQPDAKVDSGLMQRQFNTWLKKKGSLSGRMLDVAADYDRRFILVDSAIGQRIDDALEWFESKRKVQRADAMEAGDRIGRADPYESALSAVRDQIGEKFDYLSRRYLLESIKAREVVPHVREHLAMGRKVVVFHDYKKGGGFNPFLLDERSVKDQEAVDATIQAAEWNRVVREFNAEFMDIINSDLFRQSSPIDMFKAEFPGVLLFNGDVPAKTRRDNVAKFQDDASGPQVILVQSAAGKEGISLHDTTGKHQRVLFNLGQPTQPTTAIQQEGRIYRTGQVTDAIFRYLNTGTNWEKWAFATTIAQRASAAENLGMGEQARALKDAFISGFEESADYRAGMEDEGKGGKARDKAANDALTEYDRARAFYFGTQKKNSKTKAQEGADYFATPEPVGLKMVEWADIRPGEKVLEPSAGHGAIARWIPDSAEKTAIEPSMTLRPRLAMVFDGQIIGSDFESLNVVNKYDAIVMNPPFGSGGKTAVDHIAKAATHLRDGGRIVALLPTGPAADKKFDKWMYEGEERQLKPLTTYTIDGKAAPIYRGDTIESKAAWAPSGVVTRVFAAVGNNEPDIMVKATAPEFKGAETRMSAAQIKMIQPTGKRTEVFRPAEGIYMVADIKMPAVTFERAGTQVMTRIVVLEKQSDTTKAPNGGNKIDLSDIGDINELFKRVEYVGFQNRPKVDAQEADQAPANDRPQKAKPAAVGDVVTVNGSEYAIEIYTTNDGKEKRGIWMEEKEAKEINPRAFKSSKMRGTPAEGKFFVDEYWLNKRNGNSLMSRGNGTQTSAMPQQEAESRIKSILGDKLGKVLIDSGIVTFTNKGNEYQGATYKDGSIVLNLDALSAENFDGVFFHEGFHSTIRELVGEQTYTQMMKRLENMGTMGNARQWFSDAEAAIPGNTKAENRTEELAAYAVEQYTNGTKQPNVIRQWVESLLSALRTAIIRRLPFGKLKTWAVNNLQPQDLANLAIAGLRAKAQGQLQAQGREAMAYSRNEGVQSSYGLPNEQLGNRAFDRAEIRALRRLAAGMERPEAGITFRITDDGIAIATGPKGTRVPERYIRFANDNGLSFESRRLPISGGTEAPAMPAIYRTDGALYFGEMASNARPIDRTGKTRFSKINQTDTPEFKKWFGDSKVVDADGNPLVVYHATTYGDFNEFTKEEQRKGMAGFGFYFSDRYGSNVYAEHSQRFKMDRSWKGEPKQVNTMPVFLRMENPLLADNIADVANRFKDQGAFGVGRKVAGLSDDAKTAIQRAGYDGVITNEYVRKKRDGSLEIVSPHDKGAIKHPVYVVFEPTQVKSAIGNNGQFDGTNPDIRYSRAQIIGDSGRQYEPAQRQFFKNVGRDIEKKNLVERTTESLKNDFWKKMAVGIVDQFRGLRDLGDNGQAYMLARLSKGTAGAFDALLHHGKLSIRDGVYDADTSGGFIERLGTPLHGELDDFLWYVAANRAEGLSKVDRENLFTPTDIAAGKSLANGNTNFDYTIQTGAQKGTTTRNRATIYADANRVFNEFQKNTLDMAEQSGLIDGSSRKLWESEFYVPFYRVSEEDGEFIGSKMGNALVRQQAFKKLKGGTEKLNSDLLSNTLLNFSHLIEASAKNRAAKASLVAAEKIGAAHKATPGEKKTVWFMDNGKKIEYGVDDPFVMTAITSLEYAGMRNGIMDVMTKFKHWLTIGVTASPAFKVRNLIRDSIQSIGASELGYNPIKNIAEGYKQTKRDSQEYVSALASGGLIRFGTMLEGSESARVRQLVKAGVKDSTILNSENKWRAFYDQYLDPAVSAYNELGNRSEEINRAALYNQLVKQGKSHAEAALLARDLMDFSMQGSFNTIRFLTQVVPFMNARLQGMYKLGRSAKDNPRKLAVVTGAVALASIALMLAYGDDDDWKRREDWDRDNFWWFKFGDVEFRIPKPFEVGAIGTLAERGLELMIDDEMTGERFRNVVNSLVMNNLSMNPIPQAFKPILDLYANKDSFTKRPIESLGMQRLDPTERFNSNTSMVARGMSKASLGALSPVQIDHLARAYFGWLGSFVIGGADMVSRSVSDEPTKPALDYFRFGTQGILKEVGTGSSRYVTQVYEQAKEIEQAHATYRQMLKDGRMEEAKEYAEDNNDQLIRYRKVESVKKMESNLNERIRKIERSDMDSDQKKDAIALINKQKEQVAKRIAVGA